MGRGRFVFENDLERELQRLGLTRVSVFDLPAHWVTACYETGQPPSTAAQEIAARLEQNEATGDLSPPMDEGTMLLL